MSNKQIGAIITLDGEKEFKSAVTSVNKSLTTMKSELSLVKAECEGEANTLTSLSKKHEVLSRILETQKKKEEEIAKGLLHSRESYNKVGEGLEKLKGKYEESISKMEKMKMDSSTTENELKKQQKVIDELAQAIQRGTNNYERAGNRVNDWEAKLNSAKAQTIKANKELNKNAAYMKEASNSADKCAKSIDAFGKETKTAVDASLKWKEALKGAVASDVIDQVKELGSSVAELVKDSDAAGKQIQAATGAGQEAAQTYNEVLKSLYTNNYGDNFEDLSEAISLIKQDMSELNDEDLEKVTQGVITLRDTFDMDLEETIRGVDSMMVNMGVDAQTAFDLIGKGAQSGLNKSNELGDNLAEYAQLWGQAGFSAQDMFSILQNGLDAGAYNLDKVNDFVKEFAISLADGRVEKTLSSFSTGTQELFTQWKDGSTTTAQVFSSVINDLSNMKNQQDALTIASDTWSALGEDNAMQVITSLNQVNDAYTDVTGTMESMKDIKYDDVNSQITELGRNIQMQLVDQAQDMLPILKNVLTFISDNLETAETGVIGIGTAIGLLQLSKKTETLSKLGKGIKEIATDLAGTSVAAAGTTTALAGTTAATGGLSAAFSSFGALMMANPIVTAAAAVALGTTALVAYKVATDDAKDATSEMLDEIDQEISRRKAVNDTIQSNIKSRKEEAGEIESEWSSIEMLGDQLMELNNIDNKTPEQMLQMKAVVEELSASIPELSSAYNEETGAMSMNNDELKKLISSSKEYAVAKAAQSELIEIGKDMFKNEQNLAKAEKERQEVAEKLAKARKESSGYQGAVTKGGSEVAALGKRLRELDEETGTYKKTQEELETQYDSTKDSAAKLSESLDSVGSSTQTAAQQTQTATEQISGAYQTMQTAINEALSDTGDIFEEYEPEEISTDKLLKNMESQAKAFEDWQKNLKKLSKKAGQGMNEELFNQLADMGPEGAAYVEAFANMSDKELKKASNYFERRTENIVDSSKKNSKKTADNWEEGMEDVEASASDAGNGVYDKIKDAFSKTSSRIEKEGGSIASSTKTAFKKAVDNAKKVGVEIPEGLADSIESGKTKPKAAINKINDLIAETGKDLVKKAESMGIEVPNSISNGLTKGGNAAVAAINTLNNMIAKKQEESTKKSQKTGAKTSEEMGSGIKSGQKNVTGAVGTVSSAGVTTAKGYYGSFRSAGLNLSSGIAAGIRAGRSSVVNAAVDTVRAAKNSANKEADSHSPSRVFRDQVGLMMSLGMAEGIRNGKKDCISETVSMCRAVVSGAQEELEIASPSKKFRRDVGKQITKGVAFGIKEGSGEAKKTAEQMSAETYTAATKWLKNYKKAHKTSLEDEKYYWQQVKAYTKEGTDEYKKVTDKLEDIQFSKKIAGNFGVSWYTKENGKKVKKKASEYYSEILSAAEQYLDNMKVTHDISLEQEEAYWAKVIKKVKKGSQAWYDAKKNLKAVQEEIKEQQEEAAEAAAELKQEKLEYGVSGNGLEAYKTYYNVSAKAEVEYWQIVLRQTKRGTTEYQEAYENLVEARENYNDQMEELQDEYLENCKEVNDQLKEDIAEATEAYEDAVKSSQDAILSSTNLFEKFESSGYKKDTLLYNLKTQVAGLALWETDLATLEGKGLSSAVLAQIKAMGPEAAASIHSLTEMSDAEISEYNELWKKKEELAQSQAVKENETLKKETEEKIKLIEKEAQAQIDAYTKEYQDATGKLSAAIEAPLRTLAEQATTLGETATLNLVAGLSNQASSKDTAQAVQAVPQQITSNLSSLPELGRVIGQNTLDGLLAGLTDTGKVQASVTVLTDSIVSQTKSLLQINSPSRLFRDKIGKMIPAGIGVGIEEGTDTAIKPGEKMAQKMIDKIKEKTQSQNEIIATYASSIDLSGVRALNGLLNIPEQQTVVNVDNTEMADIFQRMLTVMEQLSVNMSGLQVVLDTGTVAGQLQPLISQESAVRTVRKNRGRY
ncbi:MAG: phage tail tape measure protein [Lachnospiraceae bacterium]|nr:phage tail tape measure protein [Lachnospiraceae bacterium]